MDLISKTSVIDSGIYSSGTMGEGIVRVNCLVNLEWFIGTTANGVQLVAILLGIVILTSTYFKRGKLHSLSVTKRCLFAAICITTGIVFPQAVNWCVATLRDLNVFS